MTQKPAWLQDPPHLMTQPWAQLTRRPSLRQHLEKCQTPRVQGTCRNQSCTESNCTAPDLTTDGKKQCFHRAGFAFSPCCTACQSLHTLLHPWHHEPNQESQQGSGEKQEEKREVEQAQRDKEEEMEADISLSRNYLSWTLSSPP